MSSIKLDNDPASSLSLRQLFTPFAQSFYNCVDSLEKNNLELLTLIIVDGDLRNQESQAEIELPYLQGTIGVVQVCGRQICYDACWYG